jgi:hypothetical protein
MRRFERVWYNRLPVNDQAVLDLVLGACWQALLQRDSSPGATESAVKQHLSSLYATLSGKYASPEQKRAAAYIPRTFKQALTILSDNSDCAWPALYRYIMCRCGFLYRCEHQEALQCPGISNRGKPNESPCGLPRSEARSMTYSSIGQFIQRAFKNPTIAADLAAWPDRCSRDPDLLLDICDGEVVKAALLADPRFHREPRNLLLLLVSDPFIVSADHAAI